MSFLDVNITDIIQASAAVVAASLLISQGKEIKSLLTSLSTLANNESARLELERKQLVMENQPILEVTSDSERNEEVMKVVLINNGRNLRELKYEVTRGSNNIAIVYAEDYPVVLAYGKVILVLKSRIPVESADWLIVLSYKDWHGHRYVQYLHPPVGESHPLLSPPLYVGDAQDQLA